MADDSDLPDAPWATDSAAPAPAAAASTPAAQSDLPDAPWATTSSDQGASAPHKFGWQDTWPVKLAKGVYDSAVSAATLPGDVYAGKVDPESPEGIKRSLDFAGMASPLSVAKEAAGPAIAGAVDAVAPTANQKLADEFGVTLSQGQATGAVPDIQAEQAALRGSKGAPAQAHAQDFMQQQQAQVDAAHNSVTQQLDPSGNAVIETPHDAASMTQDALQQSGQTEADALAAEREALAAPNKNAIHPHEAADTVANELRANTERAQAEADQRAQSLTDQHEGIRRDLGGGEIRASNPQEAAGVASDAITRAESEARAARDDAYGQLKDLPGNFEPDPFTKIGKSIRRSVRTGDDPVILDSKTTPMAVAAINDVDKNIGAAARHAADPETTSYPSMTPEVIDQARKRLVTYSKQARSAALASRDYSDVRAMGRVMDAFDDQVRGALQNHYNGDGEAVGAAFDNARSLHSNLRQTFSSQGSGDKVGPIIEQILGRREGQEASAGKIAQWLYGSGDTPVLVGRRLVNMFGADSPEIGAIKQGLFSHLTEAPEGVTALSAGKVADRISDFLNGKGRSLAETYLTPEERATLGQHAADLRGSIPAKPAPGDVVTKATNKIVGADGQTAATSEENANLLFGRTNVGDNATGVKLAQSIKATHGENSPAFQAVRQGLQSRLAGAERGRLGFDPAEEAARTREFLSGSGKPMAETAFSQEERAAMAARADQLDAHAQKIGGPKNDVDKVLTKIRGTDTQPPATSTEILDYLYGANGQGNKGISVRLAQRLKGEFGEGSTQWSALKQAMFKRLTETPKGVTDMGSQKIKQNLNNFLNGAGKPLADTMLNDSERTLLQKYADLHDALVVPDAAANRSGTGQAVSPLLQKIVNVAGGAVGAYLGSFVPVHGASMAGYAIGSKGSQMVADTVAARQIEKQMPMVTNAVRQYMKVSAVYSKRKTWESRVALETAAGRLHQAAAAIGVDGASEPTPTRVPITGGTVVGAPVSQ